MKVSYTFDTSDPDQRYERAMLEMSPNAFRALNDFANWARSKIKYDGDEEVPEGIKQARDEFWRICRENDIDPLEGVSGWGV